MEELAGFVRFLIGAIFRILFDLLLQGTGNLLIRILSFGRSRGAPIFYEFGDFAPILGGRAKDGTFVVGSFFAMLIGLLFWVIVVCLLVAWAKSK